jgi:hypothetical protein
VCILPVWRTCTPCSNFHNKGISSYPISYLQLRYAKVSYTICIMMPLYHSWEMNFGSSIDYYKVTTNKSIQNG